MNETFHLLMISHSWHYLCCEAQKNRQLMHGRNPKGSLDSEKQGQYIHGALTCVWNSVQVTATSSPPTAF